jgi:hypothetical protein
MGNAPSLVLRTGTDRAEVWGGRQSILDERPCAARSFIHSRLSRALLGPDPGSESALCCALDLVELGPWHYLGTGALSGSDESCYLEGPRPTCRSRSASSPRTWPWWPRPTDGDWRGPGCHFTVQLLSPLLLRPALRRSADSTRDARASHKNPDVRVDSRNSRQPYSGMRTGSRQGSCAV